MGLDVYTYIVIGVPLHEYATHEEKVVEGPEIDPRSREPLFHRDGSPFLRTARKSWYTFMGKEYHDTEEIEEFLGLDCEERTDTLGMYMFDGYNIYPQDTLGVMVCRSSQEGGDKLDIPLWELGEKFNLARKLLQDIGITEEPKIRLVMYWSS